jgi:hypothetical protein
MYKKVICLAFIMIALIVAAAGCGGGGASTGGNSGGVTETAITSALTGFDTVVDNYDVTGMLSYLAKDNGFQLTISEAGYTSPPKTYDQLKKELTDDEIDQLNWRKAPPDGNGYQLNLILSPLQNFSNISDTGGIASQTFVVKEMALSPAIDWTQTDNGTITWQMAKIDGVWKAVAMTIAYDNNANSMMVKSVSSSISNFGFGHFNSHNL